MKINNDINSCHNSMDQSVMNELQGLKEKVETLEHLITKKIDNLEHAILYHLQNLEKTKLSKVEESLNRMNTHIDFIHETYSTLQMPLTYFKNKVEYLMGCSSEPKSLPSIKDKIPPEEDDGYDY
jgi:archaellum component FlaC